MKHDLVLLPGTGSDEVFVTEAFATPAAEFGWRPVAVPPVPGPALAEEFLAALDRAAEAGPIVVGGISLGAHLAVEWALRRPERCAGLVAALPGWHGPVDDPAGTAPAAVAARYSAARVDALGVDAALAGAVDGVPGWLAAELNRAWRRAGAGLAAALRVAATRPAPALAELARLSVPAGVAACADDPVHPAEVAKDWAAALPNAELRTITFAEFGADRAALGRAALEAFHTARRRTG
ncbi:MAG TPA: alpha/beta hydrolase [Pseudonocardiaceae bacterium]|jgi:pimeloyl-ACP methyl ester carboxylesterase|nr:alpha/beta hydrolase [Pseudonocardiaceae bacterium]